MPLIEEFRNLLVRSKKHMKRKILAILAILALVVVMIPAASAGADGEGPVPDREHGSRMKRRRADRCCYGATTTS